MKAEERAILCCLWSGKEAHDITDGSHEPCDFCKHIAQHIREAEQQARMKADTDIRALLWLIHGHVGLYGDDGEMQCSSCMLDFKRDPIERIVATITKQAQKEMLLEAASVCDRNSDVDKLFNAEGYAAQCAEDIRALIEREAG